MVTVSPSATNQNIKNTNIKHFHLFIAWQQSHWIEFRVYEDSANIISVSAFYLVYWWFGIHKTTFRTYNWPKLNRDIDTRILLANSNPTFSRLHHSSTASAKYTESHRLRDSERGVQVWLKIIYARESHRNAAYTITSTHTITLEFSSILAPPPPRCKIDSMTFSMPMSTPLIWFSCANIAFVPHSIAICSSVYVGDKIQIYYKNRMIPWIIEKKKNMQT